MLIMIKIFQRLWLEILALMICWPLIQMKSLLPLVMRNLVIFWMIKRMVSCLLTSSIIDTTDCVLEEELDYEPSDDDNDFIVNVTAEDMFENVTSTVSEENSVTKKVVSNACPPLTIPPPTLPSSLMTRVRERLSTPSPAMVCWHRLHMKKMEKAMDITTSICSWHLFHASSKEKSKMLLSDRFREIQTVEKVETGEMLQLV